MKKTVLKKGLSLMLTVVMLFTCWVFVAPKTNAAYSGVSAGTNYNVKIYSNCSDDCSNDRKECFEFIIYYKPTNGTGTETSTTLDIGSSYTSTGDKTHSKTVSGFPSKITLHLNTKFNWGWGSVKAKIKKVEVNGVNISFPETECYSNTGDNSKTGTVPTASYPKASTMEGLSVTGGTISSDSSTFTVSGPTAVKDQYGVVIASVKTTETWGVNAYKATNSSGANLTSDVSVGPNAVSAASGGFKAQKYAKHYLKIYCNSSFNNGTATGYADCTLTYPQYTATYKYYTTNTSNLSSPTTNTVTASDSYKAYYGDTPSAPTLPATSYYNASKHWLGGSFVAPVLKSTQDVWPTYTTDGASHASWTYSNIEGNDTNHKKTCGSCAYNTTAAHSYPSTWTSNGATNHKMTCTTTGCGHIKYANHSGWTYTDNGSDANHTTHCGSCTYTGTASHSYGDTNFDFSEDGKSADISRTCGTTGCAHEQTGTATVTSKVQIPATCTADGTTRYTATSTFDNDDSTDTKDVVDITKLGHDYESETTAPTCTEQGYTTYTCTRGDSEYVADYTSAIGHAYNSEVAPVKTIDTDSEKAVAYYPCTREGCDHKSECKVIDNAGTPKWVAAEDPIYEATEGTEITEDTLPTSDVKCGGAAIRVPGTYQSGDTVRTGMRYLVTMDIPEGARLVDFGVLYTLTPLVVKDEYIPIQGTYAKTNFGVEDSTGARVPIPAAVDGDKVTFEYANAHSIKLAGVSYARSGSKANFTPVNHYSVYTGKQGSGSQTTIDAGNAQSIRFNCVITGLADNLATASLNKLTYARLARGYVTYEYLGQEFTIYDNVMTARSMGYIAQQITTVGKDIETRHTIQYAQSILDAITAKGGSVN